MRFCDRKPRKTPSPFFSGFDLRNNLQRKSLVYRKKNRIWGWEGFVFCNLGENIPKKFYLYHCYCWRLRALVQHLRVGWLMRRRCKAGHAMDEVVRKYDLGNLKCIRFKRWNFSRSTFDWKEALLLNFFQVISKNLKLQFHKIIQPNIGFIE